MTTDLGGIKHLSKTAVAAVHFPFTTLPNVYVIPIQVTTKKDNIRHPVENQRLRLEAIDEFVSRHLKLIAPSHGVQLRVKKENTEPSKFGSEHDVTADNITPTDRIVFLSRASSQVILAKMVDQVRAKQPHSMDVLKYIDATTEEHVQCSIGKVRTWSADVQGEDYWKKLKMVLRIMVKRNREDHSAHYDYPNDVLVEAVAEDEQSAFHISVEPHLSNIVNPTLIEKKASRAASRESGKKLILFLKDAPKIQILFRIQITLNSAPEDRKLSFEIDIVPGVRGGTNLADLALSVFGPKILGPNMQQDFRT
jgi:hypothetical protein